MLASDVRKSGLLARRGAVAWRLGLQVAVASAACALILARPARCHAYRTGADLAEFSGTARVARGPSVAVRVSGAPPIGVEPAAFAAAVDTAVAAWSLPCSALRLEAMAGSDAPPSSEDGITTVSALGSGWTARGFLADAAATTDIRYARRPNGSWYIADADIFLNSESFDWTSPDLEIAAVVVHELGHAIGLLHPCGDPGLESCATESPPLMAPTYQAGLWTPTPDDAAGACFLYPLDPCDGVSCSVGFACAAGECQQLCGGALCANNETCFDGSCVDCSASSCASPGCVSDDDCGTDRSCESGECVYGIGQLDDPCASDRDCRSGACRDPGVCTVGCSPATPCPAAHECDLEAMECRPIRGVLGDPCTSGRDCAQSICYSDTAGASLCTRACVDSCPSGFSCGAVSGRLVCRPQRPTAGCAVSSASFNFTTLLTIAAALAAVLRRRTRNS